jgi:toxin ParE1/3/4
VTYQLLPAARNDLIEIADFIALDNPARALSFIAEIEATMATIAERPNSFPSRDDLIAGLQSARHGRYLIFFVMGDEEVHIVRVLHGARDLPQAFGAH